MNKTTESANVHEMTETDESTICEVTGSVEIAKTAGRLDDGAEVTLSIIYSRCNKCD